MRRIKESSLEEYARQFMERQRKKNDQNDKQAFAELDAGGDPVAILRKHPKKHPYAKYKFPKDENKYIFIMRIDIIDEVENLLIHEYMLDDDWMKERIPAHLRKERDLGYLAKSFVECEYFTDNSENDKGGQYKNYLEWKDKGFLGNVISQQEMPLIEEVGDQEYEIVDGWGRLLPFVALLHKGINFCPFEVFLASKSVIVNN
jgi:hypothetical protein